MDQMLLWGTANPKGMSNDYQDIFLNKDDIRSMVQQVDDANNRNSNWRESMPLQYSSWVCS